MNKRIKNILNSLKVSFRENERLSNHSSWKIGGPANFFAEPDSITQLKHLLNILLIENLPYIVIGNGTNLLFDDDGFNGVVLKIGEKIGKVSFKGQTIIAEAGVWVPCFARALANKGYCGLEHIIGIPGSLGGLIAMNGGSLTHSISDKIVKVWAINDKNDEKGYLNSDCKFSYRSSIFQNSNEIITKASFSLDFGEKKIIRKRMLEILSKRRKKFPRSYPSCGSVFISNPKNYEFYGAPGKIIEQLGLKGLTQGRAQISPQHANFIVNLGKASSKDVLSLIDLIRKEVEIKFNIDLEPEVKYVHPWEGIKKID